MLSFRGQISDITNLMGKSCVEYSNTQKCKGAVYGRSILMTQGTLDLSLISLTSICIKNEPRDIVR